MKNYLLTVLENCSDEKFGQEAVEWAIVTGRVTLTYDLDTDLRAIMGVPNLCPQCRTLNRPDDPKCDECAADLKPNPPGQYDDIIAAYQRQCQEHGDALVGLYHASGLMEEILRPISLAQNIPKSEIVTA